MSAHIRPEHGDSLMRLNTTPSTISKPSAGLCVTCKHHHYSEHPFMSFPEVHGAQFLTCDVRKFRSVVNGEESNWCHDIRRDNGLCAQWENDRDCGRCKWASFGRSFLLCKHPSFEKTFTSGEFSGQSYWPEAHPHSWDGNYKIVYAEHVQCGPGAPKWEESK